MNANLDRFNSIRLERNREFFDGHILIYACLLLDNLHRPQVPDTCDRIQRHYTKISEERHLLFIFDIFHCFADSVGILHLVSRPI